MSYSMIESPSPMNIIGSVLLFVITQFSAVAGNNPADVNLLSAHSISLENRYADKDVNAVFKDNILLNIAYLSGKVTKKEDINWDEIAKPFEYKFTLLPDKTFA